MSTSEPNNRAAAQLSLLVEPKDGAPHPVELGEVTLVVAGYTGRNSAAVERHIEELAAHGVEPPASVPMLWELPNWLVLTDGQPVQVAGRTTSGEAEPVLIRLPDGTLLVTVGSDHTDRDIERLSLGLSKLVCPKLISSKAWLFDDVADDWDALQLDSSTGTVASYQLGRLELIRRPLETLALVDDIVQHRDRTLVLFLGTVSLNVANFSFDAPFAATLNNPIDGRGLSCMYAVEELSAVASSPQEGGTSDTPPDGQALELPAEVVQATKPRK